MSRTGRGNMATLKPTTPLHTHNKGPMKPASPLRPKNTPKTSISHPQRRWRFQLAHLTGPQRRRRFQTTRPPGRQGQAAAPAGGGWASPRRPWAISVTNVVKPTRFKSPREDLCYKRRQSASKTLIFSEKAVELTTFVTTDQKSTRKTPRIDDVCNNTHQGTPKTQHASPRDAHRE